MKKHILFLVAVTCVLSACKKESLSPDAVLQSTTNTPQSLSAVATPELYTVRTIAGIFNAESQRPNLVDGPGPKAKFWKPHGISVSGDGSLYVADFFNSAIRKISIQNIVSTVPLSYNTDTGGGLLPEAVTISPGGTLYIVSTAYGIRIYNKAKGIDVYNRISNSDSNLDMEQDSKGVMWFVGDKAIGNITGTTIKRNLVDFTPLLASHETLRGIGLGPNGVKYVSTATQLFKVSAQGTITKLFPNVPFTFISGISVTKNGETLYIVDGNAVKKIKGGVITTICKPLAAADGRDGVGLNADVVAANLALSNSETALFVTDIRNVIRKVTIQ
ncbi:hypothetical protein FPZ43_17495 [Mucilaginibacter pallidiroseus]|uniref:NHL repeat-containing protein n=1 Tax=Mucilaginibacter pallidiroseus TaxID=2599295 RepID=A0A563U129_9SPHI|nr:hypothetical protein [Mucilaginibacter pallidiroseus]TWR25263.1 hypothetical protein FPZ43_17495 [Mucilaginibacter pallidiroseus]